MFEWQVEESWGKNSKCWSYFETDTEDETVVAKKAVEIIQQSYERKLELAKRRAFTNTQPARPTLIIREYPKKKDGLVLKTKWR
ncbi:hypothetical protein [Chryseobacterium caseinilyticum]|uniref:Uncharacterized protein n=1 Tax=Chryseobacterium caseinilyticum TaxID=2771428 RepID=A0ABR8Z728_9FLAO|nr:hypothetical protein [Chryseobacterium caseinilyticum]MBD8081107.1 hypothetical protein [Chryseobacterium caseinilyticum]